MAGSIIGVSYRNDAGTFYALNRDESNARAEAVDGAGAGRVNLFLPAATPFVGTLAPAGFKPRYVNTFLQSDPRVRRSFPVGNPLALTRLSQPGALIFASRLGGEATIIWVVTSLRGERGARNVSFGDDTGQTDGTSGPGVTGAV